MHAMDEPVTLTLPRAAVGEVIALSQELLDQMHALLERNTDGDLSPIEQAELQTLVKVTQFGQIISLALQASEKP
jgi:hypothetical protein